MRFCIIGGANADIIATTFNHFMPNDSNPGSIRLMAGGVARNIAHSLALLGNQTIFLGLFGGDTFGWFTADVCRKAKVDISLSDAAPVGTRSCFLSINNCDGEMIGGVSDMVSVDGITPEWIATKLQKVGPVDAFIADTNIPAESLAFLIDHTYAPLYVDAVSGAKAPKVRLALSLSAKKHIHTLKCNKLENEIIGEIDGIGRRFVSKGAEGLDVYEKGKMTHFDALPCQVVNTNGSGDALMAGIALAGPQASIEEAARIGLKLAMITAECPETVNKQLKQRYEELS